MNNQFLSVMSKLLNVPDGDEYIEDSFKCFYSCNGKDLILVYSTPNEKNKILFVSDFPLEISQALKDKDELNLNEVFKLLKL